MITFRGMSELFPSDSSRAYGDSAALAFKQ
jgi:hypothetical protein